MHKITAAAAAVCGLLAFSGAATAQDAGHTGDAAVAAAPAANIRAIDFRNCTYHAHALHMNVQLHNGFWEAHRQTGGVSDGGRVVVDTVTYGDLDGDGVEEAAVRVDVSPAYLGAHMESVDVFAFDHGRPRHLASFDEGDRGRGGVEGLEICDGRLRVRVFGSNRDPQDRDWTQVQVLELVGNQLVQRSVGERWQLVENFEDDRTLRIALSRQFPAGVEVHSPCSASAGRMAVRLSTRAGQHFTLEASVYGGTGAMVVTRANGTELARGDTSRPLTFTADARGELAAEVRCPEGHGGPVNFYVSH